MSIPIATPPGLAEALMKKLTCADSWLGVARATVDRVGRVQTLDLADVGTTGDCKTALQTLIRLSLAEPAQLTSPLSAEDLVVVKPRGEALCFDAAPVEKTSGAHGILRVSGDVKAPVVVTRVEPLFPEKAREQMKGMISVVAQSVVTRSGCVRDVRLVSQSPWPDLNAAAIFALSQWKFKPGTLDGAPVDVVFNLTVRFIH
jgi:protein TonB